MVWAPEAEPARFPPRAFHPQHAGAELLLRERTAPVDVQDVEDRVRVRAEEDVQVLQRVQDLEIEKIPLLQGEQPCALGCA